MKRQAALRSSSSGREPADHHQSSPVPHVGCMSGVFHLISSKYRTRRKFLTFGRKHQEKQSTPISSSVARRGRGEEDSREIRRSSCELVPRSPTIPPEIRRSSSLSSPEASRSPAPSVVARLMGLEDTPPPPMAVTAAEKRRKLLGALEKCDEDLQALKRIIESVRSTDRSKTLPSVSVGSGGGIGNHNSAATTNTSPTSQIVRSEKCSDPIGGGVEDPEQPSPVSVLEDFCDSPPPSSTCGEGEWHSSEFKQNDLCCLGRVPPMQVQRKKPGEDNNVETANIFFQNNNRLHVPSSPLHRKSDWTTTSSPPPSLGESMEEAVNEVCRDVETGQKREIERIGVVFEDFIYRDLIEEMTKDFMGQCHVKTCLPFDKCKRKLCF